MDFADLGISAFFEVSDFLVLHRAIWDIHSLAHSLPRQIMRSRTPENIVGGEVLIISIYLKQ